MKKEKRNIIIDLLGLIFTGNDFGKSYTIQFSLGSILIILSLLSLVLTIISEFKIQWLFATIVLVIIGIAQIKKGIKKRKNSVNRSV